MSIALWFIWGVNWPNFSKLFTTLLQFTGTEVFHLVHSMVYRKKIAMLSRALKCRDCRWDVNFTLYCPLTKIIYMLFILKYLFIWTCWVSVAAWGIFSCGMWDLVPWPGLNPGRPHSQVWSLSYWTTREVPTKIIYANRRRNWLSRSIYTSVIFNLLVGYYWLRKGITKECHPKDLEWWSQLLGDDILVNLVRFW